MPPPLGTLDHTPKTKVEIRDLFLLQRSIMFRGISHLFFLHFSRTSKFTQYHQYISDSILRLSSAHVIANPLHHADYSKTMLISHKGNLGHANTSELKRSAVLKGTLHEYQIHIPGLHAKCIE